MPHSALSMLLLLFLALVMPAWSWLNMRRLKRLDSDTARTRRYIVTVSKMGALALLASWLMPSTLWVLPAGLAASFKLNAMPASVRIGITLGTVLALLMPVVLVRLSPALVKQQLAALRFMLPTTRSQRLLWVLVCLSAGIGEEWVYRGFVLHYLTAAWPGLAGWAVLLVAAAVFGLAHAYQGWRGVLATAVVGLLLSVLYLGTGNLLLPMLLHTLIDLHVLLLLPAVRPTSTG